MNRKLPPTASVASKLEGAKMHAPAAARNAQALTDLLRVHAPEEGRALEIASGTGQHIIAFARALPQLIWQPTEVSAERRASIDAYRLEADLGNLVAPVALDATQPGWRDSHRGQDLIFLANLLHLISTLEAQVLISEALAALNSQGCLILYGPFMRDGALTSPGDAQFHAQLTGANPKIGYKNDSDIENVLRGAGARSVKRVEMPANNLAFIARR